MNPSSDGVAAWALAAVGGEQLVSMRGLRGGGPPWLVHYEASGGAGSAVLRVSEPEMATAQTLEMRGMTLARQP